jgi:hypothetical protein
MQVLDHGVLRDATPEEIAEVQARRAATADVTLLRAALVTKIDADTDAIYAAAVGNRMPEYDRAASDAQAYKEAGYTGTVPTSVQTWASAKGWTTRQAADDVLRASSQLSAARDAIRTQRLNLKETAKQTTNVPALKNIEIAWDSFVINIRTQLGV